MSAPADTAAPERRAINDAWQEEGSLGRLGLRPTANKAIQAELIPAAPRIVELEDDEADDEEEGR